MQQINKKANMICWLFRKKGGCTGAISNLEVEAIGGRPWKAAGISLIHWNSIKVSLASRFIKGVVFGSGCLRASCEGVTPAISFCKHGMKEKYPPASTYFLERGNVCARKWKVKEGSHTLAPAPVFYYSCLCQWDSCRMWHLNSGLNRCFSPRHNREGKSAPVSLCLGSKSANKRHNSITGTPDMQDVQEVFFIYLYCIFVFFF